jgi:hypothetical protein
MGLHKTRVGGWTKTDESLFILGTLSYAVFISAFGVVRERMSITRMLNSQSLPAPGEIST